MNSLANMHQLSSTIGMNLGDDALYYWVQKHPHLREDEMFWQQKFAKEFGAKKGGILSSVSNIHWGKTRFDYYMHVKYKKVSLMNFFSSNNPGRFNRLLAILSTRFSQLSLCIDVRLTDYGIDCKFRGNQFFTQGLLNFHKATKLPDIPTYLNYYKLPVEFIIKEDGTLNLLNCKDSVHFHLWFMQFEHLKKMYEKSNLSQSS